MADEVERLVSEPIRGERLVSAIRQAAQPRGALFVHDLALDAADEIERLREALKPFVDIGPQRGAWGVISKKLDGMAPLTVTVTKAQMLAAFAAISPEGM